jgi:oxidoreductase
MQGSSSSAARGLRAIVIGGTGAIGHCLVNELLESSAWTKVTLISRRKADCFAQSDKLNEVVINMDEMDKHAEDFAEHDVGFSCLGTTRKDAGSAEAFRKVDLDYVLSFARLCKDNGVSDFHAVSSAGANSKSWFLYMRTKGEMEDGIKALKFRHTSIYQPGLLARGDKARTVEKLASWVSPSIPVETVGRAIRIQAEQMYPTEDTSEDSKETPSICVLGNKQMYKLVKD